MNSLFYKSMGILDCNLMVSTMVSTIDMWCIMRYSIVRLAIILPFFNLGEQ